MATFLTQSTAATAAVSKGKTFVRQRFAGQKAVPAVVLGISNDGCSRANVTIIQTLFDCTKSKPRPRQILT